MAGFFSKTLDVRFVSLKTLIAITCLLSLSVVLIAQLFTGSDLTHDPIHILLEGFGSFTALMAVVVMIRLREFMGGGGCTCVGRSLFAGNGIVRRLSCHG